MTTITWGDPIEVNGQRPAWLGDEDKLQWMMDDVDFRDWRVWDTPPVCVLARHLEWATNITHIRLPAYHWAYLVIAKGFWPWAGGKDAPSDWVPGDEVLFRCCASRGGVIGWGWAHNNKGGDIIGYKRRTEKKEEPTMTDIEAEARRRLNDAAGFQRWDSSFTKENSSPVKALCRLLEEMAEKDAKAEAFKREVSDAVEKYNTTWHKRTPSREEFMLSLGRFILPKPVDQLVEALNDAFPGGSDDHTDVDAARLREALAKRGYEIVKKDTSHD